MQGWGWGSGGDNSDTGWRHSHSKGPKAGTRLGRKRKEARMARSKLLRRSQTPRVGTVASWVYSKCT